MGKVSKVKKRDVSIHSRAARRGASPPPDLPANNKKPVEDSDNQPWLYKAHDAGIAKKRKTKQPTRQQKLRQQRGMEKAEQDLDKLVKKVANSKQKSKKIQARSVDWDELNERLDGRREVTSVTKVDEEKPTELDDKMQEATVSLTPADQPKVASVEASKHAPTVEQAVEVDEIL